MSKQPNSKKLILLSFINGKELLCKGNQKAKDKVLFGL
jgi:hypothetical protein